MVLEKTLESPLDSKELKPVNAKRKSTWIFMAKTDAKAKAPILWPSNVKSWLTEKDPDAGKDWRQEEKKVAEWESQVLGRLIRSPESRRRKEGSGALEEETRVWNSQGGGKNKGPSFFSTFLSLSHTKWFFIQPGTDDYATNSLV